MRLPAVFCICNNIDCKKIKSKNIKKIFTHKQSSDII